MCQREGMLPKEPMLWIIRIKRNQTRHPGRDGAGKTLTVFHHALFPCISKPYSKNPNL